MGARPPQNYFSRSFGGGISCRGMAASPPPRRQQFAQTSFFSHFRRERLEKKGRFTLLSTVSESFIGAADSGTSPSDPMQPGSVCGRTSSSCPRTPERSEGGLSGAALMLSTVASACGRTAEVLRGALIAAAPPSARAAAACAAALTLPAGGPAAMAAEALLL